MPSIFDNLTPSTELGSELRRTLAGSTRLDTCVGYFNLRGWSHIAEAIEAIPFVDERTPAMRLLIGMPQGEHDELRRRLQQGGKPRLDQNQALSLQEELIAAWRQQLSFAIPSSADEKTLRALRDQLHEGRVQVKMHLAFPLHAKLYLCFLQDRTATDCKGFLGSSNLTLAGLKQQGELNIDVLDRDATQKLREWFDARWADRLSCDGNQILIDLLDESWASQEQLAPYLVHLKLAYHLAREARAGLGEYDVPESLQAQLLDFQSAAVRITARRIRERDGAIIADVVGLGKTLMGIGVALSLQEQYGYETLIIAPKGLCSMWEEYVAEYRVIGKVVSRTMVHRELVGLRRYRLVIIDESHHLRTRTRRDYRAIRDYIAQNEPKTLLLTATPFNRSMEDVANQLALFLAEDKILPVHPEAAMRLHGPFEFKARFQLDATNTLQGFRKSEENEDWQRLLSPYLIRRTRGFVVENYAQQDETGRSYLELGRNKERFYLPRRLPRTLEWKPISANDPSVTLESEAVVERMGALTLPRYRLQDFLRAGIEPERKEEKVLQGFTQSNRGNLSGITITSLYKRLSSGGYAFILSLRRHLLRNLVTLQGLDAGDVVPVGTYGEPAWEDEDAESDPSQRELEDADIASCALSALPDLAGKYLERLKAHTPSGVTLLRAQLFQSGLGVALQGDNRILQDILERVPVWPSARDSKLKALVDLLRIDHGQEKVLVFTEFADTARYLFQELEAIGIEGGLGLITGNDVDASTGARADAATVARRFSPRSIGAPVPRAGVDDELRVLVATDVLSEGLNLQDCSIVVNFDLPWAIIRLIQRAGRVDRIGQQAEDIMVYSLCPTEGVEAVIDLRGRIRRRLSQSASVFGSDERFFGDKEEEQQVRGLFDENAPMAEWQDEELDYTSKAYEIWQRAEREHPQLARRAEALPDQVHATREAGSDKEGVMAYMRSAQGADRILFREAKEKRTVGLSPLEALDRTACAPHTEGRARRDDHHDLVAKLWQEARNQSAWKAEGSLGGIRKSVYNRLRYLLDSRDGPLYQPGDEARLAVEALYKYHLTDTATHRLIRVRRQGVSDETLLETVTHLHNEGELVINRLTAAEEWRLICSMGFAQRV